jgi:hypothetical protein
LGVADAHREAAVVNLVAMPRQSVSGSWVGRRSPRAKVGGRRRMRVKGLIVVDC